MNWFLPIALALSYSVRTSNLESAPNDYQYGFHMEKKDALFLLVEHERETGVIYRNESYWTKYKHKNIEAKDSFVKKSSKDILYNQAELTYNKGNFKAGYALRHLNLVEPSHRLIMGYEDTRALTGVTNLTTRINVNTDFGQVDYDVFSKFSITLMKFLDVYTLLVYEKMGDKDFYQSKVGVSVELPSISGG